MFHKSSLTALTLLATISLIPLVAGFEAHVVNVTAKIEPPPCTEINFDTNAYGAAIPAGERINTEYVPWGVGISAFNFNRQHPDIALAFGSASPTGGDVDLGTPHTDFGGPGVGAGGASGAPGENKTLLANVLVVAENSADDNGDGLVDVPKSEEQGGKLIFLFDSPTRVNYIDLLDIDEEGAKIELYKNDFGLLAEIPVVALGDNSYQRVHIDRDGVRELRVILSGDGATDNMCFTPVPPEPMCNALSIGYWRNHEGCSQGEGESVWTSDVRTLSTQFSGVFSSYSGADICDNLWIPNCPRGNGYAARLCKAKAMALADELNTVSFRLNLDALIAGADDADPAFDNLGLDANSTVGEALGVVEAIIANPSSTTAQLRDAAYVAERIYAFYEDENPTRPMCVFPEGSGLGASSIQSGGPMNFGIVEQPSAVDETTGQETSGEERGTTEDETADHTTDGSATTTDERSANNEAGSMDETGSATTDNTETTEAATTTEEVIVPPPPPPAVEDNAETDSDATDPASRDRQRDPDPAHPDHPAGE
ncbi:MAG: hypothetical protein AAB539_03555 [Patescibacteria group bacterium]